MQKEGWNNSAQTQDLTGKCALVLVPHQDDEINLAGSTILALRGRGCRVVTAFLTLSDTGCNAHRRLREALASLRCLGVGGEDVVFLGYGDSFNDGHHSLHLALQTDPDAVVPTWRGRTETDGLPEHPEWCFARTGAHKRFTRRNVVGDIADLLLTLRPDFVFGTGWDSHADHRALSLYLDEAMAQVLAGENNEYMPLLFKGFAYSTAFQNDRDYSVRNLKSVVCPEEENGQMVEDPSLHWAGRTRLPVPAAARPRLMHESVLYKAMRQHRSQGVGSVIRGVVNSDAVFWARRTDSLSYRAQVRATSGEGRYLNDFKRVDTTQLMRPRGWRVVYDASIWRPDAGDAAPTVRMTFDGAKTVAQVALFEAADGRGRILRAELRLSGGEVFELTDWPAAGLEKRLEVAPTEAEWAELTLLDWEGEPGLTEWEIYPPRAARRPVFLKLLADGQFAYRWEPNAGQPVELSLYALDQWGVPMELPADAVRLEVNGEEAGPLPYTLTPGARSTVRASLCEEPGLFDEIVLAPADAAAQKKFARMELYAKAVRSFNRLVLDEPQARRLRRQDMAGAVPDATRDPAPPARLRVEEFAAADFPKLREAWERLEQGEEMTVFQSYEYTGMLLEHFKRSTAKRLYSKAVFLCAYDAGDRPVMIAPLRVKPRAIGIAGKGIKKGAELLGAYALMDYGNFVYRDFDPEAAASILAYLGRAYPGADLHLRFLKEGCGLESYLADRWGHCRRDEAEMAVYVPLPGPETDYRASLGKSTRQNLRTAANRMKRDGVEFAWQVHGPLGEGAPLVQTLADIDLQRSLQKHTPPAGRKARTKWRLDQAMRRWESGHNNLMARCMERMSGSWLLTAHCGGKPAGFLWGLKGQGRIYVMVNRLQPEFAFYSPVFLAAAEYGDALNRGEAAGEVRVLDFGRGTERYKYELGGVTQVLKQYRIRPTD